MNTITTPAICGQAVCGQAVCGNTFDVPIVSTEVFEKFSDKPTISHSNMVSSSLTSLHSGMFKVETEDISFGAGSMAISFSHIYNSKMSGDTYYKASNNVDIRTYMGDGFKLNLQQYLLSVASGESICGDQIKYYYIDSLGTRHNIVQNGEVLYDTSGLGLILESYSYNRNSNEHKYYGTQSAAYKLSDGQGNILFFDILGRLTVARNAFNSVNKFVYYDSTTKLLSVTTAAIKSEFIEDNERVVHFSYDENDKLIEMDQIRFEYDESRLIKIYKSKNISHEDITENSALILDEVVTETIAEFNYENGILYEAKDLGGKVLRFEFENNKVSKIIEGAYDGSNMFRIRRYDEISYDTVNNPPRYTKVTNDKGVLIKYNMNSKGEMYSALEEIGDNYYIHALSPQPDGYGYGQYFATELFSSTWEPQRAATGQSFYKDESAKSGNISTWFNQKIVTNLKGNANEQRCLYSTITEHEDMNRESGTVEKQTFTISCWAKIDTAKTMKNNNLAIEFYVDYKDDAAPAKSVFQQFDPILKDWQFICFSVQVEAQKINWANIRIYNSYSDADLYLSDIRMVEGGLPEHLLRSDSSEEINLDDVGCIGYTVPNDSTLYKIDINDDMTFTAADVEQTRRNHFLANPERSEIQNPYNLSLNNGRRLISKVSGIAFGKTQEFTQQTANHVDFRSRQYSGIGDSLEITSSVINKLTPSRKPCSEIQIEGRKKNGSDYVTETESITKGFDGLELGRIDGYGVQTSYTYDRYGNLTCLKKQSPDGVCLLNYRYEADGEFLTDSWDSRHGKNSSNTNIDASTSLKYFEDSTGRKDASGRIKSVTLPKENSPVIVKDRTTTFGYDVFKQRPRFVSAWNGAIESRNETFFNTKGELSKLRSSSNYGTGIEFNFEYDHFGRLNKFKAGNSLILQKAYWNDLNKNDVDATVYANGYQQEDITDKYGFNTKSYGFDVGNLDATEKIASYIYKDNKSGKGSARNDLSSAAQIRSISDGFDDSETVFDYNLNDRLMSYKRTQGDISMEIAAETFDSTVLGLDQGWMQHTKIDEAGKTDSRFEGVTKTWVDQSKVFNQRIRLSDSHVVINVVDPLFRDPSKTMGYSLTTDYVQDSFGRPKEINRRCRHAGGVSSINSKLSYVQNPAVTNGTTEFIEKQEISFGSEQWAPQTIDYTYHPDGKIATVTKNGIEDKYDYDKLGRLSKWTSGNDVTEYNYDAYGNVSYRYVNGQLSGVFEYANFRRDQLTMYRGLSISYDACGNPTHYKLSLPSDQHTASNANMVWTRGRLLKSYNGAEYTYNKDGLRTQKKYGNTTVRYNYDGSRLVSEWQYEFSGDQAYPERSRHLYYVYDCAGLTGFAMGDVMNQSMSVYNVVTDTFGTVHEIRDEQNNVVARYRYDAWGVCTVQNLTSEEIGSLFPFRWKGHYFDTKNGFYSIYQYGHTRYYDPEIGQFIRPAPIESRNPYEIGGLNLYSLGVPNPLMFSANSHTCFPSLPLVADLISEGYNGSGWPSWLGWAIPIAQVVAGIGLMFVPGGQGFGAMLIGGGALGLFGQALGHRIGDGLGSMLNGAGAIGTGIGLLGGGPLGIAFGIPLMLIGVGTMAFGANEIAYWTTGTNYIQQWTGMSDSWYNGLYFGLNIASTVGTIAERMYLNYYHAKMFDSLPKPPGYDSSWDYRYPEGTGGRRFFDPSGGEWRWHAPDRWHSIGHWDYNPWMGWNSPWTNIYR